jgi:two-component system nitrogen regulation response regulator GlnG
VIEPKDLPPEVAGLAPESPSPSAAVRADTARAAPADDAFRGLGSARGESVAGPAMGAAAVFNGAGWETGLEAEALSLLATGRHDVWDELDQAV